MKKLHQKHINITKETKQAIEDYSIVFPVQYHQIYTEIAKAHQIELNPEELVSPEMLDEKMIRHLVSLCEYGERALHAMKTNNALKLKEVIEEMEELQSEMHHLKKIVYEDPLTKTYNRKWFDDTYLNHTKDKFTQSGTMVVTDLNKFKMINDTYGHIIGDKVLRHVANKLQESKGEVVRYGGDEFVVIFSEKYSLLQVNEIINHIAHYYEKTLFKSDDEEFKISFSYGIQSFAEGRLYEEVIKTADNAMYAYKRKEK